MTLQPQPLPDNDAAVAADEEVLELVLSGASARPAVEPVRFDGVAIGVLAGVNEAGDALVDFPGNPSGDLVCARSTVTFGLASLGRQAVLFFERADPLRPVLVGLLEEQPLLSARGPESPPPVTEVRAEADGNRLVFSAKEEIVFQCGEASITLTKAGKVLIRGAYLLSRSSGVNRIKGGSVQIN